MQLKTLEVLEVKNGDRRFSWNAFQIVDTVGMKKIEVVMMA